MASFQAKKGWDRPRRREHKNYRSDQFLSNLESIIPKKSQKNLKKNQKTPLWLLFKPKQVGKGLEREKIKIIVPISSYPTQNREFQKNSIKIKKHHYGLFSFQNKLEKAEKERK